MTQQAPPPGSRRHRVYELHQARELTSRQVVEIFNEDLPGTHAEIFDLLTTLFLDHDLQILEQGRHPNRNSVITALAYAASNGLDEAVVEISPLTGAIMRRKLANRLPLAHSRSGSPKEKPSQSRFPRPWTRSPLSLPFPIVTSCISTAGSWSGKTAMVGNSQCPFAQ